MRKQNKGISPYTSGKGRERRFIQVGNCFLHHEKVKSLSGTAFRLYQCILMEAGGASETVFTHGMAKKYGIPGTSFDRAIDELEKSGFVSRIASADQSQFAKGRYRLSLSWKANTS